MFLMSPLGRASQWCSVTVDVGQSFVYACPCLTAVHILGQFLHMFVMWVWPFFIGCWLVSSALCVLSGCKGIMWIGCSKNMQKEVAEGQESLGWVSMCGGKGIFYFVLCVSHHLALVQQWCNHPPLQTIHVWSSSMSHTCITSTHTNTNSMIITVTLHNNSN